MCITALVQVQNTFKSKDISCHESDSSFFPQFSQIQISEMALHENAHLLPGSATGNQGSNVCIIALLAVPVTW